MAGRRRDRSRRLCRAVAAEPEQLEPVALDLVAATAGDLTDHPLQAGIRDLGRFTAGAADDVMVVFLRRTGDVGVLAARQVDALELAARRQEIERPEYGRAANLDVARGSVGQEVVGREMAAPAGNQAGDDPARPGGTRRRCMRHAADDTESR